MLTDAGQCVRGYLVFNCHSNGGKSALAGAIACLKGVGYSRSRMALEIPTHHRATGLVDVLDRVLDKGLVVAGDIKVSLAEVELLTIRIRLLICSIDKAQEIGLDWWRYDRDLSPGRTRRSLPEHEELRAQIRELERKVEALSSAPASTRRR